MVIAIDIGNTNIVIGGFKDGKLSFVSRIRSDNYKTSDEYAVLISEVLKLRGFHNEKIEGTAISSVVPSLTSVLKKSMERLGAKKNVIIGAGIKSGLNILIENPAQLGADMVCSSIAAIKKYKTPFVIIDLGTATKISCVDKNKNFIGCSIMPGVSITIDALAQRTAQLPQISLEGDVRLIGKNTVDSIKSGIILGTASMIDGMIERYNEEVGGGLTIIATGGIADDIVIHCKNKINLDKTIILEGLIQIYNKN